MIDGNYQQDRTEPLDRYGLFECFPRGVPHWIEGTSDVDYAKKANQAVVARIRDSEYFVQDFIANTIVASTSDYRSGRRAA